MILVKWGLSMDRDLTVTVGIVLVVFIALLTLRFTMYGPGFPFYGPGSYNGSINQSELPGPVMGPGMMYPGTVYPRMMNAPYNGSFGPGMMGYGDVLALYYPGARPVSQEEARQSMESFAQRYGSNISIENFMTFSGNYYAVLRNGSMGENIAEVLVDRYSGVAYPEPGPNMIWNTRFGAGRSRAGGAIYGLGAARGLAEDFLAGYLPGASVLESEALPGYYTFDFGRTNTEGMLSVNAYGGEIWVHTWHGLYIGGGNETG